MRGEVRDETGKAIANARIVVLSNGYVYYSGNSGGFGITTSRQIDSIQITADGYYAGAAILDAHRFVTITMQPIAGRAVPKKQGLISFTKGFDVKKIDRWTVGEETYSSLMENQFLDASKYPETGFALNIHKASYSNIRRFLNMESPVPPDAVRLEEVLNYFNFCYEEPPPDSPWSHKMILTDCPWNPKNNLLFAQLNARKLKMDQIPPANLVFLIDVSGSMDMPNRLPLLKSAFRLMVDNLRAIDTVSIVVYGSATGIWLQPTGGDQKKKIRQSIEELNPGGATAGASGILYAYQIAKNQFLEGGNNRVILATDGDFNVGQTSDRELEELIMKNRKEGIYLTCLGVGMGNYKDSKLELLAKRGNGNFAYLDSEKEAEKVLVHEFSQTLYAVAEDVFLNVGFDPTSVAQYKLIGFNNKYDLLSDSSAGLEGGEVGSGTSVLAAFELTLKNPPIPLTAYQRYHLGNSVLQFKQAGDTLQQQRNMEMKVQYEALNSIPKPYQLAAALIQFGQLLRQGITTGKNQSEWNQVMQWAQQSADQNDVLHQDFLQMIEKGRRIYTSKKKKKKTPE